MMLALKVAISQPGFLNFTTPEFLLIWTKVSPPQFL